MEKRVMDTKKQMKELLVQRFEARRIDSIVNYFLSCVQNFRRTTGRILLSKLVNLSK
jgi:hypothetical protein